MGDKWLVRHSTFSQFGYNSQFAPLQGAQLSVIVLKKNRMDPEQII